MIAPCSEADSILRLPYASRTLSTTTHLRSLPLWVFKARAPACSPPVSLVLSRPPSCLSGCSCSLTTSDAEREFALAFAYVATLLSRRSGQADLVMPNSLLVTGSTFGPVAHFIIGGYICVARPTQNPTDSPPPMGIFAIFCFYVYTVAYTISWAGVPWVIGSESYPTAVRNFSQMSTACSNWFWTVSVQPALMRKKPSSQFALQFWITKYTPDMFATMGHDDGDGYGQSQISALSLALRS